MRKWLRILISGLIGLLVFAATYPNVILPGGGIWMSAFVYILALAFIPFVLICVFAGRNKTLEGIGWAGHFLTLAAMMFR
jgi:hypothetical protein